MDRVRALTRFRRLQQTPSNTGLAPANGRNHCRTDCLNHDGAEPSGAFVGRSLGSPRCATRGPLMTAGGIFRANVTYPSNFLLISRYARPVWCQRWRPGAVACPYTAAGPALWPARLDCHGNLRCCAGPIGRDWLGGGSGRFGYRFRCRRVVGWGLGVFWGGGRFFGGFLGVFLGQRLRYLWVVSVAVGGVRLVC